MNFSDSFDWIIYKESISNYTNIYIIKWVKKSGKRFVYFLLVYSIFELDDTGFDSAKIEWFLLGKGSRLEDVVQVSDVADGEPKDLDLWQLFVRWQGRQKLSKLRES